MQEIAQELMHLSIVPDGPNRLVLLDDRSEEPAPIYANWPGALMAIIEACGVPDLLTRLEAYARVVEKALETIKEARESLRAKSTLHTYEQIVALDELRDALTALETEG